MALSAEEPRRLSNCSLPNRVVGRGMSDLLLAFSDVITSDVDDGATTSVKICESDNKASIWHCEADSEKHKVSLYMQLISGIQLG